MNTGVSDKIQKVLELITRKWWTYLWWMGVLHIPLLLISVYAFPLSLPRKVARDR